MESFHSVPQPGWYPMTTRPGFQCYWDGTAWTDAVAPIAPPPTTDGSVMRTLVVAAGILAAAVVAWVVYGVVTADNDAGCANRNLEHAMAGEPSEDCG